MLITTNVNLYKPIRTYPAKLRELMFYQAKFLLNELGERYLEVVLVPNKTGEGMHRQTLNTNPKWYQDLWHSYSISVKRKQGRSGNNNVNTIWSHIRRVRVVGSLERIIKNKDRTCNCNTGEIKYDYELRSIILDQLKEGEYNEAGDIAPPQIFVSNALPVGTEFNIEGDWFSDSLIADPQFLDIRLLPRFKKKDLPKGSGLYFLFYKSELVYIGLSSEIKRRITYHLSVAGQKRYPKKIDKTATYLLFDYEEAKKLEKLFIAYHRPKLNVTDKDQQTDQLCFYKQGVPLNDDIPF